MNPAPIPRPFPLFHAKCRVCERMQPSVKLAADLDTPFQYICWEHWTDAFQEEIERDYAAKFKQQRADMQEQIRLTARREAMPKHGPVV